MSADTKCENGFKLLHNEIKSSVVEFCIVESRTLKNYANSMKAIHTVVLGENFIQKKFKNILCS